MSKKKTISLIILTIVLIGVGIFLRNLYYIHMTDYYYNELERLTYEKQRICFELASDTEYEAYYDQFKTVDIMLHDTSELKNASRDSVNIDKLNSVEEKIIHSCEKYHSSYEHILGREKTKDSAKYWKNSLSEILIKRDKNVTR